MISFHGVFWVKSRTKPIPSLFRFGRNMVKKVTNFFHPESQSMYTISKFSSVVKCTQPFEISVTYDVIRLSVFHFENSS